MGCPSACSVGSDLVFSVCCHDPDTGILTDADAAPPYRVYEDETPTPILTGVMAKLDDGNTTGFYTELIAVSAANGFEANKNYTVYVEATVDADKGGISYTFKATDASTAVGGGADNVTVTWTCDGVAVPDGDVWVTSDVAGDTVVAGTLQTDSNGRATFLLDSGASYYFWASKDGQNSIRGQNFVAVAD